MAKIKVNKGTIGLDAPIYQASLWGSEGKVVSVGAERVHHGYGVTENDAIADFITENTPDVMDTIYIEEKVKPVEESKAKPNKLPGRRTKA